MRKAIVILLIIAIIMQIASSTFSTGVSEAPQVEWSKTYPRLPALAFDKYNITHRDAGISFVQTSDEGYAILGSIEDSYYVGEHSGGNRNSSGIIIKTDSLGNLQWQTINPISLPSQLIFQNQNSGYLIITTGGYRKDYLFETDTQGNIQSNKSLGASVSSALQTSNNSYILVGSNGKIIQLVKIDEEGTLLWNKTLFELTDDDASSSIVEANDGGYFIVVGSSNFYTRGEVKDPNYWFIKTSSTGEVQFSKAANYAEVIMGQEQLPASLAEVLAIAPANDGGYLLAGRAGRDSRVALEGVSYFAPVLVKLDSQGNWQWSRTYASSHRNDSFFSSAVKTGDGGFLLAGSHAKHGLYSSTFLFKTDDYGNVQWNQTFGNIESYHEGHAPSVIKTKDGGYAVMGSLESAIWLAKFAPESNASSNGSTPFPTTLVIATLIAIAIVVIIGLGLLIYLIKRK